MNSTSPSSDGPDASTNTSQSNNQGNSAPRIRAEPQPQTDGRPATSPPPTSTSYFNQTNSAHSGDTYSHGVDLPWVTRDLNVSTPLHTAPSSPSLTHRVSELNLSAHPSRHPYARKNQTKTACFVHSLLQNARARSPSRSGSTDDLTRGSMLEVINKGPERRDRWNRGMTKKELSDMALGVRELSKRLGMIGFKFRGKKLIYLGGARMKLRVKTIIIITKKHDHALVAMTRQVTEWLLHHSEGKKEPYSVYHR